MLEKFPPDIGASPLFVESSGRLRICARLFRLGEDLHIFLYGGQAHLGAVALASPGETICHCSVRGHRDYEVALAMAAHVSSSLGKRVAVSSGIHYDLLTRTELAKIMEICELLATRIVSSLSSRFKPRETVMLDVNDLDKFAAFIRSGALEEKFKCGSEQTRHQILELLEKLMDTADLADECATRLIFRGLGPAPGESGERGNGHLQ